MSRKSFIPSSFNNTGDNPNDNRRQINHYVRNKYKYDQFLWQSYEDPQIQMNYDEYVGYIHGRVETIKPKPSAQVWDVATDNNVPIYIANCDVVSEYWSINKNDHYQAKDIKTEIDLFVMRVVDVYAQGALLSHKEKRQVKLCLQGLLSKILRSQTNKTLTLQQIINAGIWIIATVVGYWKTESALQIVPCHVTHMVNLMVTGQFKINEHCSCKRGAETFERMEGHHYRLINAQVFHHFIYAGYLTYDSYIHSAMLRMDNIKQCFKTTPKSYLLASITDIKEAAKQGTQKRVEYIANLKNKIAQDHPDSPAPPDNLYYSEDEANNDNNNNNNNNNNNLVYNYNDDSIIDEIIADVTKTNNTQLDYDPYSIGNVIDNIKKDDNKDNKDNHDDNEWDIDDVVADDDNDSKDDEKASQLHEPSHDLSNKDTRELSETMAWVHMVLTSDHVHLDAYQLYCQQTKDKRHKTVETGLYQFTSKGFMKYDFFRKDQR